MDIKRNGKALFEQVYDKQKAGTPTQEEIDWPKPCEPGNCMCSKKGRWGFMKGDRCLFM
jgi:hypothetical protein